MLWLELLLARSRWPVDVAGAGGWCQERQAAEYESLLEVILMERVWRKAIDETLTVKQYPCGVFFVVCCRRQNGSLSWGYCVVASGGVNMHVRSIVRLRMWAHIKGSVYKFTRTSRCPSEVKGQ
eukprot:112754-Amphidinium_carterae.3